jgi:thioredoxin-related protein
MKKKIGVLIFFLVISVMLSACTDDNEDVENAKVEELEERIYELENKNEEYEKNQKELAKGLFRYELSIGD